jgi:probable F420-dependent oxidoreductase
VAHLAGAGHAVPVLSDVIGRVGVWSWRFVSAPVDDMRQALARIEELGYGAVWYPEGADGRETISAAATLLSASERIAVGSGIASIWARDGAAAANAARTLNADFGGRYVLGLGVSHVPAVAHRGLTYDRPLSAMRDYLAAMEAVDERAGGERPPRLLAALAPRMLDLSRDHADGTLTYFVPVEHTAVARERLGSDRTVAVEQGVVLETDPGRAREIAREHTSFYLPLPNYRNNLLRLGFDDADLDDGGTDEVVDRIVAWGDDDAIRRRVDEHFAAGADHVAIQVLEPGQARMTPGSFPLAALERLSAALL